MVNLLKCLKVAVLIKFFFLVAKIPRNLFQEINHVCTLGWAQWNSSSLKFKFNNILQYQTFLIVCIRMTLAQLKKFFAVSWRCPISALLAVSVYLSLAKLPQPTGQRQSNDRTQQNIILIGTILFLHYTPPLWTD